jgi:uroporphyrinogen decarboxylase
MRALTPRERVRAALNHQAPDRVPVCIGGTGNKLTESRVALLKQHFGIHGDWPPVLVGPQLMCLDPRVLDALGTDVRYVYMRPPTGFRSRAAPGGGWYYDWGLIYREHPVSKMYEYVNHPLHAATVGDLEHFDWPNPDDPARWDGLHEEARQLFEQTDYALVAYRPKYNGLFELCQVLRGTEKLLMDMALAPAFVEALFWKVGEVLKAFYRAQLDAVGAYIEWVEMGDDLGGQNGPLISPKMYRQLLKPVHADLINAIKGHPAGVKVMYHTCGSIVPFIPDLIEIGIDILHPIQVAAKNMDPARIKADFGDRLCLLGGVDAQHTLRAGTPEQVAAEVQQRIHQMGQGGGYLLAPSHNIGDDVPLENILAFFAAARQHGAYPLAQPGLPEQPQPLVSPARTKNA